MSVSVTKNSTGKAIVHTAGVKYHVDDERQLHILGEDGKHLAAYAVGTWECVVNDSA